MEPAGTSASSSRSSAASDSSCSSAAAERLAQVVRDGPHVGAARAVRAEPRRGTADFQQGELVDVDTHGLQFDGDGGPGELVGAAPGHFLGRNRRRRLQELAAEPFECGFELGGIEQNFALRAGGLTRAVIRVGGPAEAHETFVDLVAAGVKLGQPRGASDDQRQHARGDGVQRPQVPDFLCFRDAPDLVDDVVGGPALGFIDYDRSVQASIVTEE
jgi:hypothetical protein